MALYATGIVISVERWTPQLHNEYLSPVSEPLRLEIEFTHPRTGRLHRFGCIAPPGHDYAVGSHVRLRLTAGPVWPFRHWSIVA